MKLLLLFVVAIASSTGYELITVDEVEHLMKAFVSRKMTEKDEERFQQMIELMAFPNYLLRNSLEEYAPARVTLTCVLCRATLRAAYEEVLEGATDETLKNIFTQLCVLLNIENENVCDGAIDLNLPIFTYIIRNNPDSMPETFCGLIFQTIEEGTCPFDDPRFEFSVDIPERSGITQIPDGEAAPLKILLLTDAHLDPKYESGGVGSCNEPTCCRFGQTEARLSPYEFHYDDSAVEGSIFKIHGELFFNLSYAEQLKSYKQSARSEASRAARNQGPAGYWGDYRSCDTPLWAFDDVIDRTLEAHKDLDLVYYIGDSIDHGVWETTHDLINEINSYTINTLRSAFPQIPVFIALGNHEAQPTNQYAPPRVTQADLEINWLYDSLIQMLGDWLPSDQHATFRQGGYYTVLVRPGFRVIVLNTNVPYKYNWWLNYDPTYQREQLQWLVDTLAVAEAAGERIHILSHIPPGTHDLNKVWTREYARIIERFAPIISSEFNGHSHNDEFKVFYSNDNEPVLVAWNGGSVTAYSNYNLNYKVMTFNGINYLPTEMETYIYNLTEANLTPDRRPHWFLEYDFRSTYRVPSLNPEDIHQLIYRMASREENLLDIYVAFFVKLSDARLPYFNEQFALDTLCKTVVTELYERQRCHELLEIYNNSG